MNHTLKYIAIIVVLVMLTACKGFEELNTNPTTSKYTDPNSQLTYVQLMTWGDWLTVETYNYYMASFTQQFQGEWNATNYGGQYRRNNPMMSQLWNRIYGISIKNIDDIIHRTQGKEEYGNVAAIAKVMRIYYMMILTDALGDIPYADAGKGYISNITTPAYNTQQFIYDDMLVQLKEITGQLTAEGGAVTGDVIYNGNVKKWRQLANSIRLRAAMRLTKVDPARAQAEVEDILTSTDGVITSEENALVPYKDIYDWDASEFRRNGLAQIWRSRDPYPSICVCSTFWNYMVSTSDPRIFKMFRAYYETPTAVNNPFGRDDLTDEVKTIGRFQPPQPGYFWYDVWPSGYYSKQLNLWIDKAQRPQANNAFLKGSIPGIIMTSAEVELLLAEAKVRWNISGPSAQERYKNGVKAAMQLLKVYGISEIPSSEMDVYFAANTLPSDTEKQLEAINTQLWVLHFTNAPEAYANWRRSGYPALKPANQYGAKTIDSQTIPRRLNYPLSEDSYNKINYNATLETMGGTDNWNARVWWDR